MSQLFFSSSVEGGLLRFDDEESRHITGVLRHKPGDRLRVTDGRGFFYEAVLAEAGKKQALASILQTEALAPDPAAGLHIAIAPTKNIERLEWFLEKSVEIGVGKVTPILCKRSERDTIRLDRLEKIMVSAMKQSMRAWLPQLAPLTPLNTFLLQNQTANVLRCIAWCGDDQTPHLKNILKPGLDLCILIGPEGDFTSTEVSDALKAGFQAVNLGAARLRTETAGIFAASVFSVNAEF